MLGAGASLVAISPQTQDYSAKVVKAHDLSFPVLADRGNRVAGEFGLVYPVEGDLKGVYEGFGADLEDYNGAPDAGGAGWSLPMPARYVIRRDGTIAHADVHPDYTRRPEPAQTLEQVRNL